MGNSTKCSVDGCLEPYEAKGYCGRHYAHARRHGGDPNAPKGNYAFGRICSVPGCGGKHESAGYCKRHYLYAHRHDGDPGQVERHIGERLPVPSYGTAHKRMHRKLGKASSYSCVDCGKPAYQWSYQGGCPEELSGPVDQRYQEVQFLYCLHFEHYVPRCVSCHKRYDTGR